MQLVGANPGAVVTGVEPLPGTVNYFLGNDPKKWRTSVPTYAKVRVHDVYPGIDIVYHGTQQQLTYDFVLAPGAEPRRISLRFAGADSLEVDTGGDLLLHVGGATVRQLKPLIYQEVGGTRRPVAGR
jgi:hypothetical protein